MTCLLCTDTSTCPDMSAFRAPEEFKPLTGSIDATEIETDGNQIIVCFIHPRSGGSGQQGKALLARLGSILTPAQVFDVTVVDKQRVLSYCDKALPDKSWRVLVAGGDGTVAWIVSELDKVPLTKSRPPVAIIPLGTGNDLSRALGWGPGYTGEDPLPVVAQIYGSPIVYLDRWHLSSSNLDDKLPLTVVNNYLTIGLDAEISMDFAEKRAKYPDKFTSRTYNKLKYTQCTAGKVFQQDMLINEAIRLVCDGKDYEQELQRLKPKVLLILNIHSYAGGHVMWGTPRSSSRHGPQRPNDGKLEVLVGDRTTMLVNLATGRHLHRLCQPSKIELTLKRKEDVCVQVDGEPWRQTADGVVLSIDHKNSVPMLLGNIPQTCFQNTNAINSPWGEDD